MKKQITVAQEFMKGLWEQNPIMKQVLGTCPTLAVTVSVMNGIAMGLATTFVLIFSSMMISLVRKLIPSQVRIASYIIIIATFVTVVDIVMKAKFPDISKSLGPFIPLIIVNCIILGRAEAFASKNSVFRSFIDALGMGIGFTGTLIVLSSVRELLGSGQLLGMQVIPIATKADPSGFVPWIVMILPAGAFLTLGMMFGLAKYFADRKARLQKEAQMASYLQTQAQETATVSPEGV